MSISASAVLVELNISVWPASKIDREITDKVNSDAGAVRGASQTKKNLFAIADQEELVCRYEPTQRHIGLCRTSAPVSQQAHPALG